METESAIWEAIWADARVSAATAKLAAAEYPFRAHFFGIGQAECQACQADNPGALVDGAWCPTGAAMMPRIRRANDRLAAAYRAAELRLRP